jgi:hypothetical protein
MHMQRAPQQEGASTIPGSVQGGAILIYSPIRGPLPLVYALNECRRRTAPRSSQTNIMLPKRWALRTLPDGYRWARWHQALSEALAQLKAAGCAAPRLLVLGAGCGVLPLIALRAGAAHVMCAER